MSIILKGIDIPKNASAIEIVFIPNLNKDEVAITEPFVLSAKEAIQIPKDHGRLIDITKYKKEGAMQDGICEGCPNLRKCESYTYSKMDICEWLDYAPTILETEE